VHSSLDEQEAGVHPGEARGQGIDSLQQELQPLVLSVANQHLHLYMKVMHESVRKPMLERRTSTDAPLFV
jgi:hypothetical protein